MPSGHLSEWILMLARNLSTRPPLSAFEGAQLINHRVIKLRNALSSSTMAFLLFHADLPSSAQFSLF